MLCVRFYVLNRLLLLLFFLFCCSRRHRRSFLSSLPLFQVKRVGIWSDVIPYVSWIALLTSAITVCWTMNFIDRIVFQFKYKESRNTDFFQFTFAEFATKDYTNATKPATVRYTLGTCFYLSSCSSCDRLHSVLRSFIRSFIHSFIQNKRRTNCWIH